MFDDDNPMYIIKDIYNQHVVPPKNPQELNQWALVYIWMTLIQTTVLNLQAFTFKPIHSKYLSL